MMDKNIDKVDLLIKETLSQEEAKFYNELEGQNIFGMVRGLYRGKNKWLMILVNVLTFVFLGLFIYCIVQFFQSEQTKELVKWSAGSIIFLLNVCMLKIYAWLQMEKNEMMREMKRLQLLIVSTLRKRNF